MSYWLKRSLLSIGSVLVLLGTMEAGIRIAEPDSTWTGLRRGTERPLVPHSTGLLVGRTVTINGAAFRGAWAPKEKQAGEFRLLFFGDSFVFGIGADDENTFPAQLAELLQDRLQRRFSCLNFGVPGFDFRQNAHRAQEIIPAYHPDLVVFTYHTGDLLERADIIIDKNLASADSTENEVAVERASPLSTLNRLKRFFQARSGVGRVLIPRMAAVLRRFMSVEVGTVWDESMQVLDDGPLWREAKASLLELRELCESVDANFVVVLFPDWVAARPHPSTATFERMKYELESLSIPVVDLLPVVEQRGLGRASLLDAHPDEGGYRIVAEALAELDASLFGESADTRQ